MKFNVSSALLLLTAPLFAQQLQMVSGNGQLVNEQFVSTARMVVRAVDAAGRPLAGVPVNWALTSGEGTVHSPIRITDSEGFASAGFLSTNLQPFSSWASATVTASTATSSVPFVITTSQSSTFGAGQPLVAAQAIGQLSGTAGSTIRDAIRVEVAASTGIRQGMGIPNVGVRVVPSPNADLVNGPNAQCEGPGGTVLTDQRGVAICHLVLNQNPGTLSFSLRAGESYSAGGERAVTITRGEPCNTQLSPAAQSFGGGGGTGNVTVRVSSTCSWTPAANVSWILINAQGAVTGPGVASFTVQQNDGAARTGTITIAGAVMTITQAAAGSSSSLAMRPGIVLPSATRGSSYIASVAALGGQPPYTYTAAGLPDGLVINAGSGLITGAPTAVGRYTISVTVRDVIGATASGTFPLEVLEPGQGASIDFSVTFPNGTTDVPYAQSIAITTNCANPFSSPNVTVVTGSLPPGLSLQPVPGTNLTQVAGIPTQTGTFRFALRVLDACNPAGVAREFAISIIPPALVIAPMGADVTSVRLIWEQGSSSVPSEEAVLITTGTAPTSFSVSVASEGSWLSVVPTQGTTPSLLAVRATNVSNLAPGTYNGTITISSAAPNSPFTVPVILDIRTPVTVIASPAALAFAYEAGSPTAPAPQTIAVQSSTPGVLVNAIASTATAQGWLSVSPAAVAAPGAITVAVNPLSLTPGTYTGTITLLQSGRTVGTVPVALNVTERGTVTTSPTITAVVNGASFLPGPVAPGEIVTIRGFNMGPAVLETFRLTPVGTIDTVLSNVRVWFDEQPAPLLHVSAQQITVVAPYSISGRPSVRVQVDYNDGRSAIREVPVAPSAPGLFTVGGSAQGAILNQDGTLNGSFNGAQPGSIVSLYATGEGDTVPGGIAGAIVPSTALARPLQEVSVTIGGLPAEVIYAGSAPGLPAGLMQVNARIPTDVTAGAAAPVVLTVGNASSQPGVTLFVRP